MSAVFEFGSRVAFKKQEQFHPDLLNRDFCLVGFCDHAFAVVDWDKRGTYDIHFYTGEPSEKLVLVQAASAKAEGAQS